jgi:hypothetical protein
MDLVGLHEGRKGSGDEGGLGADLPRTFAALGPALLGLVMGFLCVSASNDGRWKMEREREEWEGEHEEHEEYGNSSRTAYYRECVRV